MARGIQISKITENDSQEQRISKLNSNFQNLLAAAMKLDELGILSNRNKKHTEVSLETLTASVDRNAGKINDVELDVEKAHQDINELKQREKYDAHFSDTGWSWRKWSDGSVELWGKATGPCTPGEKTTLTELLPFNLSSVISWQASLRKTTVENIFLEQSSVEDGKFMAIVENGSSSIAIAVANTYIIGIYEKNGE